MTMVHRCLLAALIAASCHAPPNSSFVAAKGRTTLGFLDGVDRTASQNEAAGVALALAAGLLDFGTGAIHDWLLEKAADYEVKSAASATAIIEGVEPAAQPLLDRPRFTRGGALLFVRTVVVPADAGGRPLETSLSPLVLESRDANGEPVGTGSADSLARFVVEALAPWGVEAGNENALEWAEGEFRRAGELTEKNKSSASLLSAAALVVFQRARVEYSSTGNKTSVRSTEDAVQLALVASCYPIARTGPHAVAGPADPRQEVKALLTIAVDGPAGLSASEGRPDYAFSTTIPMAHSPVDELPGWKSHGYEEARVSAPAAPPPAKVNRFTATLVETHEFKKTLEALAGFVGEVELEPDDFGLEE